MQKGPLCPTIDAVAERRLHNVDQTLGDALRARMAKTGDTFMDVDRFIGAASGTPNRWANDLTIPQAEYFDKLMDYLEIDLDRLGALIVRSARRRLAARSQPPA